MPNVKGQILFNNKMRGREIERNREKTGGERVRETQLHMIVDSAVSYWSFFTQALSVVGNPETVQNFSQYILANKGINDHWL